MPLPSILKDAASGFVGGVGLTYVGMPFDTIKVRLQTTDASVFTSPLNAVTRTVREEGITALWRGSIPALTSALTENLVVFAANGIIRRAVMTLTNTRNENKEDEELKEFNNSKEEEQYLGLPKEMFIGGSSGFVSATAICPAEVLKCRLQANRSMTNRPTLFSTSKTLYQQEGMKGFFRGFPKGDIYSYYKGNTFPDDMELRKMRNDQRICLFNNSTYTEGEYVEDIKEQW